MTDVLDVFFGSDLAGQLRQDGETLLFSYSQRWLKSERFLPLGPGFPPQTGTFPEAVTRPYFEALLPEGELRVAAARARRIGPRNTLRLLASLGEDCAGALSFWPAGELRLTREQCVPLSDVTLAAELSAAARPLIALHDDQRAMLPGRRDKLPVRRDPGGRLLLPKGGAASSHVLKPDGGAEAHAALNEHYCMRLASAAGLEVPDTELLRLPGGMPACLVARYDRLADGQGGWTRLHRIDFRQVLGLRPQGRGRPASVDAARFFDLLTRYSIHPAKDRLQLLSRLLFDFLIGAAPAEAADFAFLATAEGLSLAPFCSLRSALAGRSEAASGGGSAGTDQMTLSSWAALAQGAGINPRLVRRRGAQLVEALREAVADPARMDGCSDEEARFLSGIGGLVELRSRQLLQS